MKQSFASLSIFLSALTLMAACTAKPPEITRKVIRTETLDALPDVNPIRKNMFPLGIQPKLVFTQGEKSRVVLPCRGRSSSHTKPKPIYTGPWVDQVLARPVLSPSRDHVGYLAMDKGTLYAITDKKKFPLTEKWTKEAAEMLTCSRDFLQVGDNGEHIAFLYGTARGKGYWILDGKRIDGAVFGTTWCFSPDGKRWAYSRITKDKAELVLDGQVVATRPPVGHIDCLTPFWSLCFSPDSACLCYTVADKRPTAVIDGVSIPLENLFPMCEWDPRGSHRPFVFGPKGNQVVLALRKDHRYKGTEEQLVVFRRNPKGALKGATTRWDKKIIDPGQRIRSVHFAPNGQWVAWMGGADQKIHYAGRTYRPQRNHHPTVIMIRGMREFSPDGKHLADIILNQKTGHISVSVDGQPGKSYENLRGIQVQWKDNQTLRTDITQSDGKIVRVVEFITETTP